MAEVSLLEQQPQSEGEPVFDAPWQARAFAMAVYLNQSGVFAWADWADRFSQSIAEFEKSSTIENSETYYRLWLQTLERFVDELGATHD